MNRTFLSASLVLVAAIGLLVFIMLPSPEVLPQKKEAAKQADPSPSQQNFSASSAAAPTAPAADRSSESKVGADIMSGTGEKQTAEMLAIQDKITEGVVTYSEEGIPAIEPYLTHPNPEVRTAAVDGMVQLGVPSAAPILRRIAAKTENPQEKIKLLEAAEFIELPSVPQDVLLRRIKERSQ